MTEPPVPVQRVTVVDVDVSFGQILWLAIKIGVALVPLSVFAAVAWLIIGALLTGAYAPATVPR